MAAANIELLKMLKAEIPESVLLDEIHATTERFDTSADSLIALKQAGATAAELKAVIEKGKSLATMQLDSSHSLAGAPNSAETQTDDGPSLEE